MKSRKVLLTLVIVATFAIAAMAIMQGTLFRIKSIELYSEGISFENQYLSDASGLKLNQSIFSVNKDDVKSSINSTGEYCFDAMAVIYPSTVKITLHKRTPSAIIEYGTQFLIVDENAYLIRIVDTTEDYDLPTFSGVRISNFTVGNQLEATDTFQKSLIINIIASLKETNSTSLIDLISVESYSDIYLICKNGKKIHLCEAVDVPEKLSLLSEEKLREFILDEEDHNITLYNGYFAIS